MSESRTHVALLVDGVDDLNGLTEDLKRIGITVENSSLSTQEDWVLRGEASTLKKWLNGEGFEDDQFELEPVD